MIRARATRPAAKRSRVPAAKPTVEPRPDPEPCSQPPPCVLPEPLVRSVMLRLEHAVRWANWAMAARVLRDAAQAHRGLAEDTLRPIEQRPIASLNTLAGLPNALVYALRACRGPGGPLQTVQDLLDLGQLELARQPGLTFQRIEHVWHAIEHARAAIEQDTARLLCWRITA